MKELKERLYDEEIQTILSDLGASPVPSRIEQKDWYKKSILRHVLIDSTRYLLEEFKKGLQTLGVLDAMQRHPQQFRDVFTNENVNQVRGSTFYGSLCRDGI